MKSRWSSVCREEALWLLRLSRQYASRFTIKRLIAIEGGLTMLGA
jgi:hypothetical protein